MDFLQIYKELDISDKTLHSVNKELMLPNVKLTSFARPRRLEALEEALQFPSGPDQKNRRVTVLYRVCDYSIAVAKPGKEAEPDYKGCRHYITNEKTNNPNDMLPLILKYGEMVDKSYICSSHSCFA